jgi:hypothetical protein
MGNQGQVLNIKQFSNVKCKVLQISTPLEESVVCYIIVLSVISDYYLKAKKTQITRY